MVQLSTEDADKARGVRKGDSQERCQSLPPNSLSEYIAFTPKESNRPTPPTLDELDVNKNPTEGAMVVQETDSNGKADGRVYYPLDLGKTCYFFAEHCHLPN